MDTATYYVGVTVSILNSKRVTIIMSDQNMDNHKGKDKRMEIVLLCIIGAFLAGFMVETFGFPATYVVLAIWGVLILVYYRAVAPRLPHQKTGETPKSFLKRCAKCGGEIPIASEECSFCKSQQL